MAINNYFNATPVSIDFNAVKQVDSKPAASGFADGNIIFDKTEQQFYQALSGSWIALDFIGDDFTVNKLAFNTAATETLATGELAWNADDETVDMHVGDNVTIQLGQEMVYHVINQTGTQIDNGTVVMADGAVGASGKIKVVPAIADGSVPAKYIMGVATEDIPNGALGYVTAFGKVRGFDTSSYSSGTVLYASATSSGSFTDTAPSLPNQKVTVAITLDQKSNGNVFVRPTYDDRRKSVSSISNLENVNTTENDVVYLDAGGRSGWFKWDSIDHSAATGTGFVNDDPGQGVYIAPSSDTTGASGAWVRDYAGALSVKWFGATGDGITDDTTAFGNAVSLTKKGDTLYVPKGVYRTNFTIDTAMSLVGDGYESVLRPATSGYAVTIDRNESSSEWNLENQNPSVTVQNIRVDGDNRSIDGGGFQISRLDRGMFFNVQVDRVRRSAFDLVEGVRETSFINVTTRYCGNRDSSGTDYPVWNIVENGTADPHNNIYWVNCFTNFNLGDSFVFDTVGTPTNNTKVRNMKWVNSMSHGIVPEIDGNNYNFTADQKQFRHVIIKNCEGEFTSVNSRWLVGGNNVPTIEMESTAGDSIFILDGGSLVGEHYGTNTSGSYPGVKVTNGTLMNASVIYRGNDPSWDIDASGTYYQTLGTFIITGTAPNIDASASTPNMPYYGGDLKLQGANLDQAGQLSTNTITNNTADNVLVDITSTNSSSAKWGVRTKDSSGTLQNRLVLYAVTSDNQEVRMAQNTNLNMQDNDFLTNQTQTVSSGSVGTVTHRFPVYDGSGSLVGFIPLYDSIT